MLKEATEKPRAFRSLTATLTVAFFVVSLLILLLATTLGVVFTFQGQQRLIEGQQNLIAHQAASTVKNFIQEKLSLLKATVNFNNLVAASSENQRQILAKALGLEPAFRQLILFDAQGLEAARVSRTSETESLQVNNQLKIDEVILGLKENQDYLSPIYVYEATSEPMVIAAVPVKNIFGDLEGVLVTELNLKFLWDVVGGIEVGQKGVAYVVDREGKLIAFGDASRVLKGENVAYQEEVREFVSGEDVDPDRVEISKGIINTTVVTTFVSLSTPDWAVVIESPVTEAYQSLIQFLVLAGLTFVLSLGIALFVGRLFSKKISQPIMSLRNVALELSKGKLDTRIDIKSNDEIGELGGAFNDMAQKLQTSYQEMQKQVQEKMEELTQAKGSLEEQVRQRTEELTQAKATLEQQVAERTAELKKRLEQVEAFNKIVVGREIIMTQLKKENEELKKRLG